MVRVLKPTKRVIAVQQWRRVLTLCFSILLLFFVTGVGPFSRGLAATDNQEGARPRPLSLDPKRFGEGAPSLCDSVVAPDDLIHMQYCTDDGGGFRPLLASMHSVLANAKHPERLRFHITIDPISTNPSTLCQALVSAFQRHSPQYICSLDTAGPWDSSIQFASCLDQDASSTATSCYCHSYQFHIIKFIASNYEIPEPKTMQAWASSSKLVSRNPGGRIDLANPMNFARNYVDDYLLPLGITRLIYLDTDTIVQRDINELWSMKLAADQTIALVYWCNTVSPLFNYTSPLVVEKRVTPDCLMNDGVYLLDLIRYKIMGIQDEIQRIINIHNTEAPVWFHGVHQPSFILATALHTLRLPRTWNTDFLGYAKVSPNKGIGLSCNPKATAKNSTLEKEVTEAHVLHWSGKFKPWTCSDGDVCCQQYWLPHDIL